MRNTPGCECCEGCPRFSDLFGNETIDDWWTVISGSWEEVAGRLRTTSLNALILTDGGGIIANGRGGVTAVVSSSSLGTHRVVGASNSAGTEYLAVEFGCNDTGYSNAKLIHHTGGSDTILCDFDEFSPCAAAGGTIPGTVPIILTWDGTTVYGRIGGRAVVAESSVTGNYFGVGSGSAGTEVVYDAVGAGPVRDDQDVVACSCLGTCLSICDPVPNFLVVRLADNTITNRDCSTCTVANSREYTLQRVPCGGLLIHSNVGALLAGGSNAVVAVRCLWRYFGPPDFPCEGSRLLITATTSQFGSGTASQHGITPNGHLTVVPHIVANDYDPDNPPIAFGGSIWNFGSGGFVGGGTPMQVYSTQGTPPPLSPTSPACSHDCCAVGVLEVQASGFLSGQFGTPCFLTDDQPIQAWFDCYGYGGEGSCCEGVEMPATLYARYFVDGVPASSDIELELISNLSGNGWHYDAVGASVTEVLCTRGSTPSGWPGPGPLLCCIPGESGDDAFIPLTIESCDPFYATGSKVAASDGRLWEVEVFE